MQVHGRQGKETNPRQGKARARKGTKVCAKDLQIIVPFIIHFHFR